MVEVGTPAPEFALRDAQGNEVSLKDYRGKKVVLYFYPRDNTPGCTREACAFAEANDQFEAQNAVILGVSRDSEASHQKFSEKYALPFTLLSDPEHVVLEAYGAWGEKKNSGKVSIGAIRSTVVIDENGIVEKVYAKVKPDAHPAEVLADLKGERT